jgi:hypothetical protein
VKKQKLILNDEEESNISVGLIRLSQHIPDHEFFFQTNRLNPFKFQRTEDLKIEGNYYDYYFPKFETYWQDRQTCICIITNKSSESRQKKPIPELFSDEENEKLLLNNFKDVDYIIKTSDTYRDFSLILFPENLSSEIQEFSVGLQSELYAVLQDYE